ncbi:hypothetical protein [Fervidobacterium sp.]
MSELPPKLLEDLRVDLALSEGQVLAWYDLSLETLFPMSGKIFTEKGLSLREVLLPEGRSLRRVRFLAVDLLAKAQSTTLRHLAGLATLRRLLGAREGWRVNPEVRADRPDAVWGQVAVEYDAGEYSVPTLRRKLGAFEAYPAQLWGTVSPRRRRLILELAKEMRIQNLEEVFEAPWG